MAGFQCPFCNKVMSITSDTSSSWLPCFYGSNLSKEGAESRDVSFKLYFFLCPSCGKTSAEAYGIGKENKFTHISLFPRSPAKLFPDYIPAPIREDYEEAYAIVNLSPKSSATLARRCLQGIIRDFFGITRKTLAQEIDALETLIPPTQWKVLNGLRRIGNIGAHMERDVNTIVEIDPEESQKLLKLIEHLIEQWYVQRHEQEQLYADIIEMDQEKQQQRSRTN